MDERYNHDCPPSVSFPLTSAHDHLSPQLARAPSLVADVTTFWLGGGVQGWSRSTIPGTVIEISDWAAFPDAARTSRWRDALWLGPHYQRATFRRWVQNVLKPGVHLAPSVKTWGAGCFYCRWQNVLNRVTTC